MSTINSLLLRVLLQCSNMFHTGHYRYYITFLLSRIHYRPRQVVLFEDFSVISVKLFIFRGKYLKITSANSCVMCSQAAKLTLIKSHSKSKYFRACITAKDGGPSVTMYNFKVIFLKNRDNKLIIILWI